MSFLINDELETKKMEANCDAGFRHNFPYADGMGIGAVTSGFRFGVGGGKSDNADITSRKLNTVLAKRILS